MNKHVVENWLGRASLVIEWQGPGWYNVFQDAPLTWRADWHKNKLRPGEYHSGSIAWAETPEQLAQH